MPEPVSDEEEVHSFISEDELNKKKRLKWESLMPGSDLRKSVCRSQGGHDVRESGEVYAAERMRTLSGWATLTGSRIRDVELEVVETPGLYDGHCDIIGWSDSRESQQEVCSELALWATIHLIAVNERQNR